MKRYIAAITAALLMATFAMSAGASVKAERNQLRAGNKLYNSGQYSEAEVHYRKALEANPQSAQAQFNLASALLRQEIAQAGKQAGQTQQGQEDEQASKRQEEALGLFKQLAENPANKQVASKACYNLGNIAYASEQYDRAIEDYKQALRYNPNDDNARYNLRMAQLKKQQQDQNKNNQDKNKDQDKDKDKNKNKDKQQQDKNKQDKDKKNDKDQQQKQQQQGGMSKENMEQILRTMQNQENATRQRVNERAARMQNAERARTRNRW